MKSTIGAATTEKSDLACHSANHLLSSSDAPVLYVLSTTGTVHAFDYSNLLKSMKKNSSSPDPADDDDTEASVGQSSSLFRSKSSPPLLRPLCVLSPPSLSPSHPHYRKEYIRSSWALSSDNSLLAVAYNECVTCVYDVSQIAQSKEPKALAPVGVFSTLPKNWFVKSVAFSGVPSGLYQLLTSVPDPSFQDQTTAKQGKLGSGSNSGGKLSDFQFIPGPTDSTSSEEVLVSLHSLLHPSLCMLSTRLLPLNSSLHHAGGLRSLGPRALQVVYRDIFVEDVTQLVSKSLFGRSVAQQGSVKRLGEDHRCCAVDMSTFVRPFLDPPRGFAQSWPCLSFVSNHTDTAFNKCSLLTRERLSSPDRPIDYAYQLMSASLDGTAQKQTRLHLVGQLKPPCAATHQDLSSHTLPCFLSLSDLFQFDACKVYTFIPHSIVIDCESLIAVQGTMLSPRTGPSASLGAIHMDRHSALYVHSRTSEAAAYFSYTHAAFLHDVSNPNPETSNIGTLLALSKGGLELVCLPSTEGAVSSVRLPEPTSAIWAPPKGTF